MASVQKKGGTFSCQFLHLGKRHTVTVGKVSPEEAEDFAGAAGLLLGRILNTLFYSCVPQPPRVEWAAARSTKGENRPSPRRSRQRPGRNVRRSTRAGPDLPEALATCL